VRAVAIDRSCIYSRLGAAAAEKFMVYNSVPPAAEAAGLDCKAWLAAALAPAAGKGGGR
jgi:hypothetical protein